MKIQKPIFIVGIGRSGSTLFHRLFCKHPQVAWLSVLCEFFPGKPWLNKVYLKIIDYPLIPNVFNPIIKPQECYRFWEYYNKGFRRPFRDLVAEDVTVNTKKRITAALSAIHTKKRKRLVAKVTGWPRIRYLLELFPDAQFIHVVRDPRAVVYSIINMDWWWGWRGPQNWRWGELDASQKKEWDKYNRSFIALAAMECKIIDQALGVARDYLNSDHFLEITYEDLCAAPQAIFEEVTHFCGLQMSKKFSKMIGQKSIHSANYKWKEEFTSAQKIMLNDILQDYLTRYGYI